MRYLVIECLYTHDEDNDGGNLIIEDNDYATFIAKEPKAAKWVRPFVGAEAKASASLPDG